eukprot:g3745.t1
MERTQEFKFIVNTIRKVSPTNVPQSGPLPSSRFTRVTQECLQLISTAQHQLSALQNFVKKQSLFSRNDAEFDQLIFSVKKTAQLMQSKVEFLQSSLGRVSSSGSQLRQHYLQMLNYLRRNTLDVTSSFQKLIQSRTAAVKTRANRFSRFGAEKSAFSYGAPQGFGDNSDVSTLFPSTSSMAGGGKLGLRSRVATSRSARPYIHAERKRGGDGGVGDIEGGVANLLGDGEQPLLISSRVYKKNRKNRVLGVEKHVAELGKLFGKLTELVAAQGETVEHIDDNIENALDDVNAGQAELLKYYETISKNRTLILKVFGILVASIFVFVYVRG